MDSLIDSQFRPILGHECWGVYWDIDTGLHLDFGAPHLEVKEPRLGPPGRGTASDTLHYRRVRVLGDRRLWISPNWKLTLYDGQNLDGSSPHRDIGIAIARLDGQRLLSVDVRPEAGATRFSFDLGAVLDVSRDTCDDSSEVWWLTGLDGMVLVFRGNGSSELGPSRAIDSGWVRLERRA